MAITGTEQSVQEILDHVESFADRTALDTQQSLTSSFENDYLHIDCEQCNRVAQQPEHVAAREWAMLAEQALKLLENEQNWSTPLIQKELALKQERLQSNDVSLHYWQVRPDTSLAQEAITDCEERIARYKQCIANYTAILVSREAVGQAS